jgi:hypothetical protein
VLRHFLETHLARRGAKEGRRRTGGLRGRSTASDDGGDDLMQAFGIDSTAAPWIRARVNVYLARMLRHFGLDPAWAQEHPRPEMQAAELRCAACTETRRCRRFLAGVTEGEQPAAFCPNAPLLKELARQSPTH